MTVLDSEKDFLKYIIKKYNDNKRINHILAHVADRILEPTEHRVSGNIEKNPTRSSPYPICVYDLEPTDYGYMLLQTYRPILHPTKLKSSLYNIINEIYSKIHIAKPKAFQDLNFQDDPCPNCYTLLFSAEMAESAPTDAESLKQIEYDLQNIITERMLPPCVIGNTPAVAVCQVYTIESRYIYRIAWVNNQKSLNYLSKIANSIDTAKTIFEKIEEIEGIYSREKAKLGKAEEEYNNAFTLDREREKEEIKKVERDLKIVAMDCCDKVENLLRDNKEDTTWGDILDFLAILISNKKATSLSNICGDGESLFYINKAQLSRYRSGAQDPNYVNSIKLIFVLRVGIITALVWLKKARYTFSDNKLDKRLRHLIEYKKHEKFGYNDYQELI